MKMQIFPTIFRITTLFLLLQKNDLASSFAPHSISNISNTENRLAKVNDFHAEITNIRSASATHAGVDPDSAGKVNQDVSFYFELSDGSNNPQYICGAVLDGHGKKGHVLNDFLQWKLPSLLKSNLISETMDDGIENVLVRSFEDAHYEARMNETVPAARSGTTCTCTVVDIKSGTIHAANVGDSRAIMVIETLDSLEKKVLALTTETTTKLDDERERIENADGRIDGSGNVWYGPVGIAMTRALGDSVMMRAGVLPTPVVTKFQLRNECKKFLEDSVNQKFRIRIIIASDGIFDVMKNEEVNDFLHACIQRGCPLEEGCELLVEEARARWQAGLSLEVRIDDATVVAFEFEYIHR